MQKALIIYMIVREISYLGVQKMYGIRVAG